MIAVTTFSERVYNLFGKRFLESAIAHWPTKIIAYHEGNVPDIAHEKIEYRNLFDIKHCVTFLQYIQNLPAAHGKTEHGYDYNFDCWKFCRKVFAQLEVLAALREKVYWLDADLEFTKDVPEQFIHDLFDNQPLAYLGRTGWYTETGFIGFDTAAPGFDCFLHQYAGVYQRGTIFALRRWHDCEAFDYARTASGIGGRNLSSFYVNGLTDINVLEQSALAEYMVHHKGPSKYGVSKILNGVPGTAPPGSVPGPVDQTVAQ